MPSSPTYPGVYVQEIPSGVRTITGTSTSVTAFVGVAIEGPVNEPVTIHSFAEFEVNFGGLWYLSGMSYAVHHYFLNGGSEAIILRIAPFDATQGFLVLPQTSGDEVMFLATSPGSWFGRVYASVNQDVPSQAPNAPYNLILRKYAQQLGPNPNAELLAEEIFRNVTSLGTTSQNLRTVLENGSKLARVATIFQPEPLDNVGIVQAQGGEDGTLANAKLVGGGFATTRRGMYALDKIDGFNILCIPPLTRAADGVTWVDVPIAVWAEAAAYAAKRRAILLIDPPVAWTKANAIGNLGDLGSPSANTALYFPRISMPDPLRRNMPDTFAPSGAVAGAIARTDAERGIWKAPAGLDARLVGVNKPAIPLTDPENGELNPLGVNVLRAMPAAGTVIWGARTLVGADRLASEWKYLPVRRLALYIEESLYRGTQWIVFEPNDASLWGEIRLSVGAFMHQLFRQGAFQGDTPSEAYFVKCDAETTTQNDVNQGVVNIIVGFAPLKPAEFVVIKLQQMAGQIA